MCQVPKTKNRVPGAKAVFWYLVVEVWNLELGTWNLPTHAAETLRFFIFG
jgi:hypothetical protein